MTDQQKNDHLPQVQVLTNGDGTRFYGDIPDYRTSDAEARAEMDALIATVDPYDLNTIMAFGKDATNEVLAVSRRINERVTTDESFMQDMREFGEQISGLNTDSIADKLSGLAKGSADFAKNNTAELATGIGLSILAGPVVGILAALGLKGGRMGKETFEKSARKIKGKLGGEIDYEGQAESVRDELRKSILSIRSIVSKLESAEQKIPGYIEEVNQMGQARVRAYGKLSLAIGAGNEVVRRFVEDVLPAFAQGENVNIEDVRQLQSASDAMNRRVEGMISGRAVSLQNVTMLANSIKMYTDMQFKIQEHLTSSVPEWEGQIAHGNMLVDQFDLQKTISAADKKGGQLMENQQKLFEASKKMNENSMQQGTYALEQVAKATEKMALRLSQDMKNVGDHRQKQVNAQQRVLAATDNLSKVFHESAQQRARNLLAGPKSDVNAALPAPEAVAKVTSGDKAKTLLQSPTSNDNKDGVDNVSLQKKTPGQDGPGGLA